MAENRVPRVLFDTNVVLDVLLDRKPWVTQAKMLWTAMDEGHIVGYIAAVTLTNIFYTARKPPYSYQVALEAVRVCLEAFEICSVDRQTVQVAAMLPGHDFEDNVQIACATLASLDAIVSRDVAGFERSTIPAYSPDGMLAQLGLATPDSGPAASETTNPTPPGNNT